MNSITWALIALAVFTALVALYVKNPYIKAGILAWELLP